MRLFSLYVRERWEDGIFRKRLHFLAGQGLRREAQLRRGWLSKIRNVGADRQFDYQFPRVIGVVIVLAEPFPNLGGRSANHRIQIHIVDWVASKSLNANGPFL